MTAHGKRALLGVNKSLSGKLWQPIPRERYIQAEEIAQINASLAHEDNSNAWPDALCLALAERGICPEEAPFFLNPRLKDLLPNPHNLKDIKKAANIIVEAAKTQRKVAIFADYDVDGASSAALLFHWFNYFGNYPSLYVPDRVREGYGPNKPAIKKLAQTHSLIICVDCGTMHYDALKAANGTDVIVLDHHNMGAEMDLPSVRAVVNPNRPDEDGSLGYLAAAGVVFLTLVEANRVMKNKMDEIPDLIKMLDFVGLATLADVVPLRGVNRAFVQKGLKIMRRNTHIGLTTLIEKINLKRPVSTEDLKFYVGPCLNAGGRIGQADLATRLLCARDHKEAEELSTLLITFNQRRRDMEKKASKEAIEQAKRRGFDAPLVWAASENWHEGIVGIVAARLKEASGKPAFVFALSDNKAKGSGRSVLGVNLGAEVLKLFAEGKILTGGGHHMAAGLSVKRADLETVMAQLCDRIIAYDSAQSIENKNDEQILRISGLIMPNAVNPNLIALLEKMGPFDQNAPQPRFVLPDQCIFSTRIVGENHLKIRFGQNGASMDAIAFKSADKNLGRALRSHNQRKVHLAGCLVAQYWQNQVRSELHLEDAAFVKSS